MPRLQQIAGEMPNLFHDGSPTITGTYAVQGLEIIRHLVESAASMIDLTIRGRSKK
jgi:hypothetical protein